MAKGYISNRQKNLKIGISSYTENQTVLEVTGNVGIGTDNPSYKLEVEGSRAWFKPNSDGTEAIALSLGRLSDNNIAFYDILTNDASGDVAIHRINRYTGTWNFRRTSPTGEVNGLSFTSSFTSGTSVSIGNSVGNTQVYLYTNGNSYFNNDGAVLVGSGTSTGTANQKLQVTGGAYVSGNLGVGVTNPTVQLELPGNSTNTADLKIGQFFIQNYSTNNTFFGNNAPWNGSSHTRSETGSVELFQFFSGGFQIRLYPSDVAGTSIPETVNFKLKNTGEFGVGSSITGSDFDGSTFYHNSQGDVGIGTTNPQYKLEVNGSFAATTKSFVIDHPTEKGMKLRYGSLEGPENGVYVRGRTQNNIIEFPNYWINLIEESSITVNLTPIGESATPRVRKIENNTVEVFSKEEGELDYFYIIFAERKDVPKLEVEF
jgi:hypothetical protein